MVSILTEDAYNKEFQMGTPTSKGLRFKNKSSLTLRTALIMGGKELNFKCQARHALDPVTL